MSPEVRIATQTAALSREKQQALLRMHSRSRARYGVLSAAELTRLRFVRWLYQSGRTTS